jgi:hypothetical protein
MTDYGVFANLVATVTSLAAAAGAVILAFTKRSRWQPPEEAVPAAVSRMAALAAMLGIALLYVYATKLGTGRLAIIAVAGFAIALVSLIVAIKTNINYSFYYPAERKEENRRLGGNRLTSEAHSLERSRGLSWQQLFEDAQGDKDLVWTRQSQSAVNIRSTLSFIMLIGAGACCLAAAGMLVATSAGVASQEQTAPRVRQPSLRGAAERPRRGPFHSSREGRVRRRTPGRRGRGTE